MFDKINEGRWWNRAWSLVSGCSPVSEGCQNCWLAEWSYRFQREGEIGHSTSIYTDESKKFNGDMWFHENRLDIPLKTKKPTAWAIWSDLFHPKITFEQIKITIDMIQSCKDKQHIFLILTKRIERAVEFWRKVAFFSPTNLWLGVTVENQKAADERIPYLLQTPAAVKFLSVEPMLESVNLLKEWDVYDEDKSLLTRHGSWIHSLDWVIAGGESGHNARPCHPDWVRNLRDQCLAAGVPFFFKQWGEYLYQSAGINESSGWDGMKANRVGKKKAGRILDGREWNELPVGAKP